MSEIGHNSNGVAGDQLRTIIERYERLDLELNGLKGDQKDILKEAKSLGFEVGVIREIIKRRKKDPDAVDEFEALLETYLSALGDFADTPLGVASRPSKD